MAARKNRVILIHGVNIRRRNNHLKRLAPAFKRAGFCVVIPSYGYVPALLLGLFQWLDQRIADSMAGFIQPDDILIGHSNGGTLVYLISKQVKVRGAVLLNPALDPHVLPHADFVHVYFNHGDIVTRLSGFMPFGNWGCMGAVGYLGPAKHVTNIDEGLPPECLPALDGHSDIFRPGHFKPWARFMAEFCVKALRSLGVHHG